MQRKMELAVVVAQALVVENVLNKVLPYSKL